MSGRGGIPRRRVSARKRGRHSRYASAFPERAFRGNSGRRSKSARLFREALESSTRRRRRDEEHQDLTTTTRRGTPRTGCATAALHARIGLGKGAAAAVCVTNFLQATQVRPGAPQGGDGTRGAVRRGRGSDPFPLHGTSVSDATPPASDLDALSGLIVNLPHNSLLLLNVENSLLRFSSLRAAAMCPHRE